MISFVKAKRKMLGLAVTNGVAHSRSSDKGVVLESLCRNNCCRVKTAEGLGMHNFTLWCKVKTYNIG